MILVEGQAHTNLFKVNFFMFVTLDGTLLLFRCVEIVKLSETRIKKKEKHDTLTLFVVEAVVL